MRGPCPCLRAGMPYWTSRIACPRPAPRPALRAGRPPKPPVPQRFPHSCIPFPPARVDNVLVQAPGLAAVARARAMATRHGLRRSQRTNLHGAEAAGSFSRAGREPTPPSSTAPPNTPPRRCLRGVQAPTGSRTSGQTCTPVCAAARGPVRAVADTPLPLDYPSGLLGYQAIF